MNPGRLRATLARTARPAGVGIAAALGGGLLYVPAGVAQGAGPQAPVSYLLAGAGVVCLAVAFAVVASGPFGDRGPVYGAVARVWGYRHLGALAAWAALAGYVGLLALLAEWLGRLAPLPESTGAYVEGTVGDPTGLAAVFGIAPPGPAVGDALAVGACAVALAVHLSGRRRASLVAAVPAWGVVAGVGALLLAAFVPGVGEFVPGNFDPLYPSLELRAAPVRSLLDGAVLALFAFVGVEAAAYAVAARTPDGDVGDTHDRAESAAPVVAAVTVGALVTLTALVSLGVIHWTRLNLADIPAADAIAAYLPVDPVALTAVVSPIAGVAALVALGVPAARTLDGVAELFPPLSRGPAEPPVLSLVAVYGVAAVLAVADLVAHALYVAVPGLALSYLAVAATAAAMPARRPDLWEACRFRPSGRPLLVAFAGALVVGATLLGVTLTGDPATVLVLTLHRVALSVFEFELVSDPIGGVVPALVLWELVGLGLLVVLRDYREAAGHELAPVDGDGPDVGGPADPDGADPTAEDSEGRTSEDGDGATSPRRRREAEP